MTVLNKMKTTGIQQFPVKLENYIKCKVSEAQHGMIPRTTIAINNPAHGSKINGVELKQINELLAAIPAQERKIILSNFAIAPKYEVLNRLIVHPSSKLRTDNLTIAVKVARVITESDRIKDGLLAQTSEF